MEVPSGLDGPYSRAVTTCQAAARRYVWLKEALSVESRAHTAALLKSVRDRSVSRFPACPFATFLAVRAARGREGTMRERDRVRVRAAVAALALVCGAPAAAQSVPVQLYPLDGSGDARALVDSAFLRIPGRARAFTPAKRQLLGRTCGVRPAPECLQRLAGAGVIVTGNAREAGGVLVFALHAVDGKGRTFGPIRVGVDAFISNAEPVAKALLDLEALVLAGAPAVAAGPAVAGATPAPVSGAVPLALKPESGPPPGLWMRPAGMGLVGTGAVLLAASAVTAYLGKQESDALDEKYRSSSLAWSDRDGYSRVDRLGSATNVLLVAGGVAAAAGATMWGVAPVIFPEHRGASVGLSGRF